MRLTIKGESPIDAVGCTIAVELSGVGYRGWSNGNKVSGLGSEPLYEKAEARQMMQYDSTGTALSHQCTARVFVPNATELVANFALWHNAALMGDVVCRDVGRAHVRRGRTTL